jgi:hypothetical protein
MTMWDCALSDKRQEQFQQAIRDVIVTTAKGIEGDINGRVRRSVPPHIPGQDAEEYFAVDALPNLGSITVASAPDEPFVLVFVYLHGLPDGVTLTVDTLADPTEPTYPDFLRRGLADRTEGSIDLKQAPVKKGDPDTLASLSDEYASLSESLLATLARTVDAPPEERQDWWAGDEASFVAGVGGPGCYAFQTGVVYSEKIEQIYAEGRHGLAQQLGLPY